MKLIFYNICELINPNNPLLVKRIVKSLFFTGLSFALANPSMSQVRIPGANPLSTDMKKVIRDYPHHFASLQGAVMEENPQSVNYACNFQVDGAESSSITRYSSKANDVFSWQALMLTTEDFEAAKKKFRALFNSLNNLTVKMDYGETFYLTGKYVTPVEEKKFTSVILTFEKADRITQKMKLEISMHYEMLEWKIRVLIYERDREDEERGETIE
ncbi:MAG: hypothetical protein EOO01_04310 [Chitinophagaceae bacterium]|nr:MAG: hypothetical protein EOO01_04310 [Chitinophagaceae bacterium]